MQSPRADSDGRDANLPRCAQVEDLYAWVDSVPLSRPKRNIARDFSDGVLMAEILSHFYPKLVPPHTTSPPRWLK